MGIPGGVNDVAKANKIMDGSIIGIIREMGWEERLEIFIV